MNQQISKRQRENPDLTENKIKTIEMKRNIIREFAK